MSAFLISVITTLVTTSIIALISQRHLRLVVPDTDFYSPLSNGTTIQLTLINGSFRSEENITIRFNNSVKCELLAASRSDFKIDPTGIVLNRLNQFSKASVVIMIEGKNFSPKDIIEIDSKEAKGKILKNENDASFAQNFVGFIFVLLFCSAVFLFGTWMGSELKVDLFTYAVDKWVSPSVPIAANKVEWIENDIYGPPITTDPLFKMYKKDRPIRVENIRRAGKTVIFDVIAENLTDQFLSFNAAASSPTDESSLTSRGDFYKMVVPTGDTKKRELELIIPADSKQQLIIVEFTVEDSFNNKRHSYTERLYLN